MRDRVGSLKHLLSSCQTALTDGRYKWRHDQILKEIVEVVNTAIRTNTPNYQKNLIKFVRAGVKAKPKEGNTQNTLSLATDWELRADLETRLKFPNHTAQTSLRPDILIFSNKIKKILIWELTVTWKEYAEEAHERKKYKYEELLEKCKKMDATQAVRQSCSLQDLSARPWQTLVQKKFKKIVVLVVVGERHESLQRRLPRNEVAGYLSEIARRCGHSNG